MNAEEKRWREAVVSLEYCVLCGRYGVEWSHSNQSRGMSQKADPCDTAALCGVCHYAIDNGKDMTQAERRAQHDLAIRRTHNRLYLTGRLKLI